VVTNAAISDTKRDDIEGLRAIAVLAVLINHAFPRALSGGFAGVDVFFVISGYLIGRHLLQDIQAGRFSFLNFYAKRARRIFPALALVLISVCCVGWFVLSATEFSALGKHVSAATIFANNVLLWCESGYFDATSLEKPLLHLWSLGIEEQFYLLVPAILWLGTKNATASIRWVARAAALSLMAAILLSGVENSAAFYLLHTRFWELASGVVLAQAELRSADQARTTIDLGRAKRDSREVLLYSLAIILCATIVFSANFGQWTSDSVLANGALALAAAIGVFAILFAERYADPAAWRSLKLKIQNNSAFLAECSSIGGILLILGSLVLLTPLNWPGAKTLFPVLGSALVVAAGPSRLVNRLLAYRPLVFIGGISYPLYLWHWPAIVYWRMWSSDQRPIGLAIPLAVSFALAWLTKTFLEEPVRFGRIVTRKFTRPPLWPEVAALALAGTLGIFLLLADGLPSRFPPSLRAIASWSEANPVAPWRIGRCYHNQSDSTEFASECTPANRPGVPRILLWGDSHAAHLYPGLQDLQASNNFDIVQWTVAGCTPLAIALQVESASCNGRRTAAWENLRSLRPDVVVLAGAWEKYQELGAPADEILRASAETIRRLKALGVKKIVLYGPGPFWNASLPIDLFRYMASRGITEIPGRLGTLPTAVWQLDADMAIQATSQKIQYVSVLNFFCDKAGCLTIGDRSIPRPDLLFRDRDHLTVTGSRLLVEHSDLDFSRY
jgi:peptidoglycan/LPS O-acetylase OafA/YrhL